MSWPLESKAADALAESLISDVSLAIETHDRRYVVVSMGDVFARALLKLIPEASKDGESILHIMGDAIKSFPVKEG